MRKILSLVLVLSLVLGSFSFAFAAPADVEGTDYEDAVTRLSALEILSGFPDGTFRPNETITRAQFAKIMVTALGVGEAAKYAAGETKFADVPANHWAAGYINVASDMGIINGYGNGNFGPEDQVTYAQAVTMIVRGLGYEPKAQAMGGYPGGYLAVAAEKEITEDITIVDTLAATRGDVALMVDASLDVPMMVQKTWGQFPEYEEDETKTLLTSKLGVDEVEGRVTAIPKTDSSLDEDEITIGSKDYTLLTDVNVDSLLGLEVTVWADGSDVFFVDVDTDEDAIYFDTVAEVTDDEVKLYVEDDEFDWAKDAKVFINFTEEDIDEISEDAYGYFVMNDDDEVVYANLFEFKNNAKLVTEVDGDEIEVQGSGDLDLEDFEDGIHVYDKYFNKVDIDEVAVDSVIYTWDASDELYMVVVNEKVSGELDRVKDTSIKVDGTDYTIDTGAYFSTDASDNIESFVDADSLSDLVGENVEVVLDVNGDAHYVMGDVKVTSDLIFGLLKDADKSSFSYKAKIFTQDGEEVVYEFEDSDDYPLSFDENTLVAFELNKDGEIAEGKFYVGLDEIKAMDDYDEVSKEADENKFYLDDDDDLIVEKDNSDNTVAKYYVEDGTILFNVEADGDAELVEFEDIEDITDPITTKYVVKEDKGNDLVVVVFENIEAATTDVEYAVVTSDPWLTADGWKVEVDVFGKGVQEFFLATDEEDKLEEGQVITLEFNADDEMIVKSVETSSDTVDQRDGKYIDVDDSGTNWVRFDSDAVIYLLDEDGDIDKALDYSDIDEDDVVIYLTDDSGRIVALTVLTAPAAEEEEPDVEVAIAYTDGTSVEVTLSEDADEADYVVVIGEDARAIQDGEADFDGVLENGKIYTAKLVKLDDMDTVIASKTFVANITEEPPVVEEETLTEVEVKYVSDDRIKLDSETYDITDDTELDLDGTLYYGVEIETSGLSVGYIVDAVVAGDEVVSLTCDTTELIGFNASLDESTIYVGSTAKVELDGKWADGSDVAYGDFTFETALDPDTATATGNVSGDGTIGADAAATVTITIKNGEEVLATLVLEVLAVEEVEGSETLAFTTADFAGFTINKKKDTVDTEQLVLTTKNNDGTENEKDESAYDWAVVGSPAFLTVDGSGLVTFDPDHAEVKAGTYTVRAIEGVNVVATIDVVVHPAEPAEAPTDLEFDTETKELTFTTQEDGSYSVEVNGTEVVAPGSVVSAGDVTVDLSSETIVIGDTITVIFTADDNGEEVTVEITVE